MGSNRYKCDLEVIPLSGIGGLAHRRSPVGSPIFP